MNHQACSKSAITLQITFSPNPACHLQHDSLESLLSDGERRSGFWRSEGQWMVRKNYLPAEVTNSLTSAIYNSQAAFSRFWAFDQL